MSCETCAAIEKSVNADHPHVIRKCVDCGCSYKTQMGGKHGYGIKVEKGDQFIIPAGFLNFSANPLKSNSQMSLAGVSWLAELLFGIDFVQPVSRQDIVGKLDELSNSNEAFFINSDMFEGLDLNNSDTEEEVHRRLSANPKTIEWWGYMAAGLARMAKEAVEADDAATAAWASVSSERFRMLAIFRQQFEEAVFMGNSAGRLLQLLKIWGVNRENALEGFWQETFKQHAYAFSQLFAAPVTFIQEGAYVGGMKIDRKDARYVDFMLSSGESNSAILIEIKTPETPLIGPRYRKNAFSPSKELSGSVVQIGDYANKIKESAIFIGQDNGKMLTTIHLRKLIVIGNYSKELVDEKRRSSFELFRSSLNGIDIVTFDELFSKLSRLAELFNIKSTTN